MARGVTHLRNINATRCGINLNGRKRVCVVETGATCTSCLKSAAAKRVTVDAIFANPKGWMV